MNPNLDLENDILKTEENASSKPTRSPKINQIRIPGKYKLDILQWLDGLGISRSTLFPDIDGVAATTKFRVVDWYFREESP